MVPTGFPVVATQDIPRPPAYSEVMTPGQGGLPNGPTGLSWPGEPLTSAISGGRALSSLAAGNSGFSPPQGACLTARSRHDSGKLICPAWATYDDKSRTARRVHHEPARDRNQPLGVTVSHESVPATGAVDRLTLGQAALAAGMSLRTLKAFTEELKGTPHDLRAPGPGNRVLYDPARLSTWLHHRDRLRATTTGLAAKLST